MIYGYARVSTLDQDTALQYDALRAAGVSNIFRESGSGVGPRPRLQNLLGALRAGDLLVVWKIDRLARSLSDLLQILGRLKAAGAAIRSLTEPIDTSTPIGEFTFQILGAVAQLERSMIRERVIAGQAAAKARGKTWGPPRVLDSPTDDAACEMYLTGEFTIKELAALYSVSESAMRRRIIRVCASPRDFYLKSLRTGARTFMR